MAECIRIIRTGDRQEEYTLADQFLEENENCYIAAFPDCLCIVREDD